ncbi:hypothetical protein JKP88DRAFT_242634 [Tribonema minus]|uniref:Uncharacterized protein n=1 Tax=Tribonema minus TaxID=303371 RepID=A0A835ZFD2_9STRA|nr:hypothetical protein JKP88DRAFT_242634 [Tribonema minus]
MTTYQRATSVFLSAQKGTTSNSFYDSVYYQLPLPIQADEGCNVLLSVQNFSMVNSRTVISSYNNVLTLNGVSKTVIPGNYSAFELVAALQSSGVNATYNKTSLKVTLAFSVSTTVTGSMCTPLGITSGSTGTSVSTSNSVQLTGPLSVYIGTNLQGGNAAQDRGNSILVRIPNSVPTLDVLHYSDAVSNTGLLLHDTCVQALTIYLTDEFGAPFLCSVPTAAPMIQRGLPMLARGAEAVGAAASNPYLQHLGQKIGVNPKTFGSIQQGAGTIGAGLGMLPQLMFPQIKSPAAAAVSVIHSVTPITGSSFAPGNTISFDIPTTRGQWLDPAYTYVQLTITPTFTGAAGCQFNPWDFVDSLNLYSSAGAQQLESVSTGYASLFHCLRDLCSDATNVLAGDTICYNTSRSATSIANGLRTYATVASGTSITLTMPLISVLGTLSAGQTYIPLHALNSSLRLDLGLASVNQALSMFTGVTGSPTYAITSPSLNLCLVTVGDLAMQQIEQMTGGVYAFNCTTYRTHRAAQAASQLSNVITIPARADSLKHIIFAQRLAATQEVIAAYSNAERTTNNLATYAVRVGSAYLTQKPVVVAASGITTNGVGAYMEAKRIFGNTTSETYPTLLTASTYFGSGGVTPAADLSPASFLFGIDCSPFNNVSALLSGTSTLTSNVYLELVYGSAPAAAYIDAYVCFDSLFTISKQTGSMSIVF